MRLLEFYFANKFYIECRFQIKEFYNGFIRSMQNRSRGSVDAFFGMLFPSNIYC